MPIKTNISATVYLLVTVVFLIVVLSVPLSCPQNLIWLSVYPIVQSEMSGIGFGRVFLKSLWILPLVILIGVFNPLYERQVVLEIGSFCLTAGWISFTSIILRGLLSFQAVILLTMITGFYQMCDAMHKFGFPRIFVSQMQLTYRYMMVILEETIYLDYARKARGFGRKSYPLKQWGRITGQLLLRCYDRSTKIHNAMLSRGYTGIMPIENGIKMNRKSWIFLFTWTLIIALCRILPGYYFL